MRKMLLVLIVIVVVFGALYYINLQLFQEMLRQQAEDEFGGEASVPKYQSDCVVCTDGVCISLGEECWKINVTTDDDLIELSVTADGRILDELGFGDDGESGSGETGIDNPPPPAPEDECTYQYTQEEGGLQVSYTNTGCSNPQPTCDQINECRSCSTRTDCLGVITSSSGGVPIESAIPITSTQYSGFYTHASGRCVIDDSVIAIYDNVTDYDFCLAVVESHVQCVEGACDFI